MADAFRRFSDTASAWSGSSWFFILNLVIVATYLVWGLVGGFSEGLNLVTTTGLTIVTQLLVCLVQATQNRDGRAVHLKLDELLRASREARTQLAAAEDMAEAEVEQTISEIKAEGGEE